MEACEMEQTFCDMVTGTPGMYNTQACVLWSEEHLYIAFMRKNLLLKHIKGEGQHCFLESDLEVFIDGGDCYYELEVNAANTVYEVFFIWKDAYTKGAGSIYHSLMCTTRRLIHSVAIMTVLVLRFGKAHTRGAYGGLSRILICRACKRLCRLMEH